MTYFYIDYLLMLVVSLNLTSRISFASQRFVPYGEDTKKCEGLLNVISPIRFCFYS